MDREKIVRNSAKCLRCGDEIESKHRHDFKRCSCGNISVDGGKDYLKRSIMRDKDWKDTSIWEPKQDDNKKLYECRYEVVYYALANDAKAAQQLVSTVSSDDPFDWYRVSAHEFVPDKSTIADGWEPDFLVYGTGKLEDVTLGEAIQMIKDRTKTKDERQLDLPFKELQ